MVTWADAVAAIGTVGAFGLGLVIYGREARDRFRAQAADVSAWAKEVTKLRGTDDFGHAISKSGKSVKLGVHNGGGAPVHEFRTYIHHDYTSSSAVTGGPDPALVIPPGGSEIWVDGVELADLAGLPRVHIEFRDAFGRRWLRTPEGKLRKVIAGKRWERWRRNRAVKRRRRNSPAESDV